MKILTLMSFENYLLELNINRLGIWEILHGNKVPGYFIVWSFGKRRSRLEESEKITKQRRPDLWEKIYKVKRSKGVNIVLCEKN